MTNFTDLQTKRRSIYALGKNVELSNQELFFKRHQLSTHKQLVL